MSQKENLQGLKSNWGIPLLHNHLKVCFKILDYVKEKYQKIV